MLASKVMLRSWSGRRPSTRSGLVLIRPKQLGAVLVARRKARSDLRHRGHGAPTQRAQSKCEMSSPPGSGTVCVVIARCAKCPAAADALVAIQLDCFVIPGAGLLAMTNYSAAS